MRHLLVWMLVFAASCVTALADEMKMAVTTSFHNSGLSDVLLPAIKEDLGLDVHLLVVGTGQALRLGAAGDVDAILVHSRIAEDAFLADGNGTHRREIMYNDFVVIGPKADAADVKTAQTAAGAMAKIAKSKVPFVSRGDDSGTHKKERSLWQAAGQDADDFSDWYRAVGAGMGKALNTASAMNAYILADRASWLNFKNRGDLVLLFQGDEALFNQYAYIPVNPDKHSHVNGELAITLEEWLASGRAKMLINKYKINDQALFTFNATP